MLLIHLKPIDMNGIRDMIRGTEKAIKNRYGVDLKIIYEERPESELASRNHEADIIKEFTLKYFDISDSSLCSKSRRSNLVLIRRFLYQAFKRKTNLTLSQMALRVGGRDHSSVINLLNGFDDLFDTDKIFRATWNDYNTALNSALGVNNKEVPVEAIPV